MNDEIQEYNKNQNSQDAEICNLLSSIIANILSEAESKVWHSHPVWFLNGNPIVGYSKQKAGIRLMFWSGSDFDSENLAVKGKKFKDSSIFYNNIDEISTNEVNHWLEQSREIQWDYKNIVKRKGRLERVNLAND